MLVDVEIQHELNQRPFQHRTCPPIEREASAGEPGTAGEIQDAELFADLPMGAWRETEPARLAPRADNDVASAVPSVGNCAVRQVGDR